MSITIEEKNFGLAVNPLTESREMVRCFTLKNTKGMSVSVIQLGAIIQSVSLPDDSKKMEDVCLGFDDIAGYVANKGAYIGGTLGRVANRVANGEYTVEDTTIKVTKNIEDRFQLHGGFVGFDSVIWEVVQKTPAGVVFRHDSEHGHEGYPGTLTCLITYRLDNENRLSITFEATTDRQTVVNLSNHAYYNLAGHASGAKGLAEHTVEIASCEIVDTDDWQIPTGNLNGVADTVFDLRSPVLLGDRLKHFEDRLIKGFDNCFVVNGGRPQRSIVKVAKIVHPPSGRAMEVWTDQPGMQFYTANNMSTISGKKGARYVKHGSFCVETEKFPDAMNHPEFPSITLEPNENYRHEVVYWFKAEKTCRCCYKK
ncbi:galactose mutarotase [Drosophila rhopaloa]|uniref:Aldose 1-epimerase n=1 Tax=Drosophila rhopaloa TaxID=1041015 RepID=A0A6P4F079_DRORH|nr:galactose mutarotase [Drosophila rhopaloa]